MSEPGTRQPPIDETAFGLADATPPYGGLRGRHLRLGRRGEDAAERHLAALGYRILERRFRTRVGEIDLIAEEGSSLVFVEVKTRSSLWCGRPAEAIDRRKRARIAAAASLYLALRDNPDRPCRFDVVEVLEIESEGECRIRLIRDAFEAF